MLTDTANKLLDFLSGVELGLIRNALKCRAEHAYSEEDYAEFVALHEKLGGEGTIQPYRAVADLRRRLRQIDQALAAVGERLWTPEEIKAAVEYNRTVDPRDPRRMLPGMDPIFRDHNCSRCKSGERACVKGDSRNCDWPIARND